MTRAGKTGAVAAALMVCVGTYCSSPDADVEAGSAEAAEAPAPAASEAPVTLSDAEIAAIVVTANSIDVQNGEIARERATDEQVRAFAETMIRDHTAVNASAGELVARLGVTPQPSDVSRSLESSAEETRRMLTAASGDAFDRAYIDHEVEYHQMVLDALDNVLIPNATNAELRETLVGVRPAFEAHLKHAESLQQTLGT
jgi:putative membrane protein